MNYEEGSCEGQKGTNVGEEELNADSCRKPASLKNFKVLFIYILSVGTVRFMTPRKTGRMRNKIERDEAQLWRPWRIGWREIQWLVSCRTISVLKIKIKKSIRK